MKIMIIRHGDPDYSIDSLTEKGWIEAEMLSERLVNADIDDFYLSPLGRAKDTASITLKKLGKEAEILDWLHEFRGKVTSPCSKKVRESWDLPPSVWCREDRFFDKNRWSEPDLMAEFEVLKEYEKVTEGIDELLEKYGWMRDGMVYRAGEDKTIALVCHFALGITVLSYLLGISPVVAQNSFYLAPTSVTTLVSETDKSGGAHFRAIGVGDISHLYASGEPMSESGLYPCFEK